MTLRNQVELPAGTIQGLERDGRGVLAFKGIPYAAPPVGELRWRPPQDVSSWYEIRDASAFGKACLGPRMSLSPSPGTTESEDCLTLNVWTAARHAEDRRPVMVWIHGGGFEFGSSSWAVNDGARLAERGVVLVSVNYRLGVFGFLAHPDLDQEGTPSGNFGLQDLVAALLWVRQNIACFGGDAGNVTIFGESAGAHAIGLLMASPLARGLFHKAIGQSGAYWDTENGPMSSKAEAIARGQALMSKMGAGTIAELRALSAERLNEVAAWDRAFDPSVTAFSPSIDGYVLPESPARIFHNGEQIDVPLLAGWNTDEHFYFMARALPHDTVGELRAAAARQFGEARVDDFLAVYPAGTRAEAKNSAERLMGDMTISQQVWEWLGAHRRAAKSPVFAYNFDYSSPYCPHPAHGADVPFVFGTLDAEWGPPTATAQPVDHKLADLMMSYWVNFAATGNPNGARLPSWPHYEGPGSLIMRFAPESGAIQEEATHRFRFIQSFRSEGVLPLAWRMPAIRFPALSEPLPR